MNSYSDCFEYTKASQATCNYVDDTLEDSEENIEAKAAVTESADLCPAVKGTSTQDAKDEPEYAQKGLSHFVVKEFLIVIGSLAYRLVAAGETQH